MGLDMYLEKQTYVKNWDFMTPEERHSIHVMKNGQTLGSIKQERVKYIIEEVGYWRKFNALHNWFVQNCQDGVDDCKEYYVDEEKIRELIVILKKIIENPDDAHELLPNTTGFFFGSQEYDERYISMVQKTLELFENLLMEMDNERANKIDSSLYYQSSW